MKSILDGAMRKAAALTSRQNLTEATKVIQNALSGEAWGQNAGSGAQAREDKGPSRLAAGNIWSALTPLQKEPAPAEALTETARKSSPIGEIMHQLQNGFLSGGLPDLGLGSASHARAEPGSATFDGAQFLTRTYSCAAGSRDYKLFVPSMAASATHRGQGLPLIVMLHGCKQDPDDFALGTDMNALAEQCGFFVAYPKQSSSSNQMGCWNWFNRKDQVRESGEPSIIAGLTREIMTEFNVDADQVFVAGLSAGGAMAAILGATHPDLFRAAGIHSGLPCGAATDVASAFTSMRHGASMEATALPETNVRTIVFQGAADRTVHPSNADLIVAFASAGLDSAVETKQRGRSGGGIAYERTVITDMSGVPQVEYWAVEGMGHAWSGGRAEGSFTDPNGPDASREMLRFFLQH